LKLRKELAEEVDRGAISVGNATWLTKLSVEDQRTFAEQAREMPTAAFSEAVKVHLKGQREAVAAKPFKPKPKLRSAAAIKAEFENIDALAKIVGKECHDVVKATLAWALQLDDESIADQRAAWERQKAKARNVAA
jgi:hypothetical protein